MDVFGLGCLIHRRVLFKRPGMGSSSTVVVPVERQHSATPGTPFLAHRFGSGLRPVTMGG